MGMVCLKHVDWIVATLLVMAGLSCLVIASLDFAPIMSTASILPRVGTTRAVNVLVMMLVMAFAIVGGWSLMKATQRTRIHCPFCQRKVREGWNVCPHCGTRLHE